MKDFKQDSTVVKYTFWNNHTSGLLENKIELGIKLRWEVGKPARRFLKPPRHRMGLRPLESITLHQTTHATQNSSKANHIRLTKTKFGFFLG